jgi:hypothetical protein
MSDPVCPCDIRVFPPELDIPAGLSSLPRELAGFPEFRGAMLAALSQAAVAYPALGQWRARDAGDFGLMLLEMWAYVCDVVAFYDQAHANEGYLRTAVLPASLRRLVGLIGYIPRPELAASALLGVLVDGRLPVVLPSGTGFRSIAVGAEPPQVFETSADVTVSPDANQWGVVPPRATTIGGTVYYLLLDPATARVRRDDLVWLESGGGSGPITWVGRAAQVAVVTMPDGGRYTRVDLAVPLVLNEPRAIAKTRLFTPGLKTGLWTPRETISFIPFHLTKLGGGVVGIDPGILFGSGDPPLEDSWSDSSGSGTTLLLNSLNRVIVAGDRVLLEIPSATQPVRVVKTDEPLVTVVPSQTIKVGTNDVITPATKAPVTRLYADRTIPDPSAASADWSDPGKLVIHYGLIEAGTIVASASTVLSDSDPIVLTGVHVSPSGPPPVDAVLLAGADQRGVESDAAIDFTSNQLTLDSTTRWQPPLELPVQVWGNVVSVTRGETVASEVLGNGDATQKFQSFVLQKKPLTYVPSATAANDWGAVSTLRIWVNGIEWSEAPTLYGVGPSDPVFIVRRQDDGGSVVTFGSPLPTGVGNIVARYRYGGGAATPPAFGIRQIARPVEGLRSVANPVAAAGGADAEGPDIVRTAAPRSALLLGRAVSIDDFAAAARLVGSVRFATAEWRWSSARHRPVVQIWYIGADGLRPLISQRVRAMADPSTPIDVTQVLGMAASLGVDVETDPKFDTTMVLAAVTDALIATGTGFLEPERQGIGTTLFRSAISAVVAGVAGAVSVRALTLNNAPFDPYGRNPGPGRYFDFAGNVSVTGGPPDV